MTNILVAGVGGQGVLFASDVIAEVALAAGLLVIKSEIHGMAQRAGSVYSHVRFGPGVHSPIFDRGEGDFLLALERLEALRWQAWLRPGGTAIVNDRRILPVAVALGEIAYPPDDALAEEFARAGQRLILVDAQSIARELGNVRVVNAVILGVLSRYLDADLPPAHWEADIARRVPVRAVAVNLAAFQRGRA